MIFVTGEHACGKTHLSQFLVNEYRYEYIDLGPTLRAVWSMSGFEGKFGEFIKQGEEVNGPNFADEILSRAIDAKIASIRKGRELLIAGSRSIEGITYLRNNVTLCEPSKSKIVYVEVCNEFVLRERYNKREGKNLTREEFDVLLAKDRDMGVLGIKPHADWVIPNDGHVEVFEARCRALHDQIEGGKRGKETVYKRRKEG